jgi:hypothetical protein
MKRKNISHNKSIIAIAAASLAFTACDYIGNLLPPDHNPPNDNPIQMSSSSKTVPSSSPSLEGSGFETWYGANGAEQIQTGLGNETETYGYWFSFDDAADGGLSRIVWPVPLGNEYSDDSMQPVIEACNGLCGSFILNKGNMPYNPFVGVGFNLVGETSAVDPTPAAGDASSMGGICVSYTSDIAVGVQMGLGYEVDAAIGYAFPEATLPKSPSGTTKHIAWSDFKQPAWYKGDLKFTGEQAASQLVNIRFMFQAANGKTGKFNIMAVGPYGGCTESVTPVDPPTPTASSFETWFGSNGSAQIITGYDNGTETSGYWFSYSDDIDGGLSTIVWPVTPGNDYDPNAFDPIIMYCGGLCGTAVLDKGSLMYNPFVAVGFNLAGETSMTDFTPMAVDASAMGGVCITYMSEVAPTLQMGLGDQVGALIDYAEPTVALPKSKTSTTKFIPWSDFKQPAWYKGDLKFTGEQAAKQLVSLKFLMQAAQGSYAFNIQAIGPYDGSCHGPAGSN